MKILSAHVLIANCHAVAVARKEGASKCVVPHPPCRGFCFPSMLFSCCASVHCYSHRHTGIPPHHPSIHVAPIVKRSNRHSQPPHIDPSAWYPDPNFPSKLRPPAHPQNAVMSNNPWSFTVAANGSPNGGMCTLRVSPVNDWGGPHKANIMPQ